MREPEGEKLCDSIDFSRDDDDPREPAIISRSLVREGNRSPRHPANCITDRHIDESARKLKKRARYWKQRCHLAEGSHYRPERSAHQNVGDEGHTRPCEINDPAALEEEANTNNGGERNHVNVPLAEITPSCR
jgi:hypothetical protein